MSPSPLLSCFFFFNDTATTEIYTLSLHDALPIYSTARRGRSAVGRRSSGTNPCRCYCWRGGWPKVDGTWWRTRRRMTNHRTDRKSTRLNSSHSQISYAVFCLKKKKKNKIIRNKKF